MSIKVIIEETSSREMSVADLSLKMIAFTFPQRSTFRHALSFYLLSAGIVNAGAE